MADHIDDADLAYGDPSGPDAGPSAASIPDAVDKAPTAADARRAHGERSVARRR